MLRRLKSDVECNLLPKKEIYLYVGMSNMQKELYKKILSGNIDVVNSIQPSSDKIKLQNVLMQLKKVCNHPYLFDHMEPGPPFVDGAHLYENAQKLKVLDLLLPKLIFSQGFKVLIFSQMTKLLNVLDDFLRWKGYKYCRIDGQTSANDREERIEDFQREGSDKQVFILSTRAGGLGINLHAANVVIVFDSDWNPQVDLQAIDRAHRIGQRKQVIIYRLVTEGSVEEKIVERAARKLQVDHLIMQKGNYRTERDQKSQDKLSNNEMLSMIKYGAQEIISTANTEITEKSIDEILEHSLKRTEALQDSLKQVSIEDKFNLNSVALTGDTEDRHSKVMYTFEGNEYKKGAEQHSKVVDFVDIGPRRMQATNYNINSYYRSALYQEKAGKREYVRRVVKGWRQLANGGHDHQFFDVDALD
jgi:superfamily II DNA/RNA helicase